MKSHENELLTSLKFNCDFQTCHREEYNRAGASGFHGDEIPGGE